MIYVDTSVVLAQLLAEDRVPNPAIWKETLVSSRLLEYELWNRLHARGDAGTLTAEARDVLGRIAMLELHPHVLVRALEPFPVPVRTLDALHLASAEFLRREQQPVRLATYDARMEAAARKLRIPIYALDATGDR